MKNYKIGVLGLSETRWLQTGQLRFSSGEQLLYSGHTEDGAPHTEGVALMLAPEAQRALIGWEPVNSRIITAKFITKKKDIKLTIIQCYAPTNDAEEEKKDDFYQQLQTVIDRGGAKDMTILMGDFNAKIGSDNTGYEDTMGTHGLGQMNENGERFANFCALNQLVIGGSIFPHKRIHKATWRSPDHVTENQIDHICISRKFRRSWRDVRVMRGADVSSDHHLLATTLRLRLKRHTNANNTRTRYNVGLLRNTDTQAAFRISLSNRFQPLQDLIEDSEMDIETHWEHSKKLWHDTCEEVLGKRKTQHKEWISADTIQKLEVRKEKKTALNTSRTRRAKAKAQEEYTAADREVKRSTRKDKRDYIDNLASQAEEAARQGNLKDLYQVTKKLAGKFQQTDKPVKDKNGHPLTTTEEQLKRWAEHFRELLNRPIPETPPDIPPAETELPINCDKPSKAEIRKAIMTLRNGKAAGPDEIPAEAIKADTETAVNMLHSLFSKIWEKEEVPAQWKEGIVIKLPKKGDLRDCSNYRGIMLLSVPGKVLNRILLERMREAVDPMLRDQQAGFRRNRSCADQIASLRIIVEQSLEWNSPLYINFIDYEKAFDSVDREALWKLLRHYGVPGKIISLIQCTYQDMSCRIAHAGQLSESFEVKTGVRQGCLLSPFLFLLVIDWIMKTTTAGRKNGIQWTLWTQLDDLDFADDLALLSHSHSQMQDKTTRLEATSAGTGLKINRKKTELMKINTTANTPVTVGGEPIREVESFVYLGSVVDGQGGTDRDVTARIGKARAAMVMLKNIWASKVVSIRTKLRIFNSNVKSVLLYGCETWRTTKTMQQKIQTFLNTCLRRIFNIRWPEKIRNEELWERAGQEPVAKQILRWKWGWIGHTLRKPASSTTRQALTWNPQGKRKRGRPRNSWRRDTEAELCKQGTNWTGVARLAQNRVRWRRVVDGLCSTWSQGPKSVFDQCLLAHLLLRIQHYGHYMYIDARGKMAGDHAVLASPIIDWPATQGCLSFWVSMYGNDVGTLRVKAVETTGMAISQVLWYRTGQLGLGWKEVSFTVDTNVPIRLQFEGERGSGTEGDIAIDDVTVTQGPCVVATTVPPALVPTPPLPGALPMGPDPTGPPPVGSLPGFDTTTTTTPPPPPTTPNTITLPPAATTQASVAPPSGFLGGISGMSSGGINPLAALFPGLGGSTNTGPQKPSIPFQSTLQFSCLRPSTPCNEMYGMCESATGRCICFNQNYGLTCDISAARGQNGGMCQINNPCTRGQCYDDGVGAACACPDGFYGTTCQNEMVHTECEDERMVVNIFPYGFNPAVWIFVDPPGTETCDMVAVSTFLAQTPGYHNRGWAGFARAFKYVNDPCAGNASIEWDTDTSTLYSRQLYVYYGIGARHATDNVIKVTCEVAKVIPTPSPGSFPPPRVMVVVKDSRDNPVRGPIRLGFKVKVVFDLNVPNNAGVNDVQVEQCVVRDAFSRFSVDVVKNRCAEPPVGQLLYQPHRGRQVLMMTMHKFPGVSAGLYFQCKTRVQTCSPLTPCGNPPVCPSQRVKRSAQDQTYEVTNFNFVINSTGVTQSADDPSVMIVKSDIIPVVTF
nr:hypothetical protein BaRGS_024758 [Batillaria attramentaria]